METLILSGKLQPTDGGDFEINIQYRHVIDTGKTFPTKDGRGKPRLNVTEFQTTIAITEGKSVNMGGIETNRSYPGKPAYKSKTRFVLVISKYKPVTD